MKQAQRLMAWEVRTVSEGGARLVRNHPVHPFVGGPLLAGGMFFVIALIRVFTIRASSPEAVPQGLYQILGWAFVVLAMGMVGFWVRRRWFHEELLVRENYLEHRRIFGRWRQAVRLADGWLYIEECSSYDSSRSRLFQLRARGKAGQVIIERQPSTSSFLGSDFTHPTALISLGETLAQETGWPLDVPYLLKHPAGRPRSYGNRY